MSKRRDDDELNQDGGYSLEEILAEFGSGRRPTEGGEPLSTPRE